MGHSVAARDAVQWSLFDRLPMPLAYFDRTLRCRYANQACERWFGVAPNALIDSAVSDWSGPDHFGRLRPHVEAALRGSVQVVECSMPSLEDSRRICWTYWVPDLVDDGTTQGLLLQIVEITGLRQAEASLALERARSREFEDRLNQVSAQLTDREEVFAVLSHEVRQPLNTASAALHAAQSSLHNFGMLEDSRRVERARDVLDQVAASIDNTLALDTLLPGAAGIVRQDIEIDTLLALAVADMPPSERDRISVVRRSRARMVAMDLNLARLALRNLLHNALKFSAPPSRVDIIVTDADEPAGLILDIVDAGPGVPDRLLPRLFQRGAGGEGRHRALSHGLGLYIARRVMELHQGRIGLVRNGPSGATFRLWIG